MGEGGAMVRSGRLVQPQMVSPAASLRSPVRGLQRCKPRLLSRARRLIGLLLEMA